MSDPETKNLLTYTSGPLRLAVLKRDPALSFKLLRYINSAGFGLSCEVQSIRHAVSILGMQPLYRWLSLLLVTAGTGPTAPPAFKEADGRAASAVPIPAGGRWWAVFGDAQLSELVARADAGNTSIQRSPPRWVAPEFAQHAARFISALR